MIYSITFAVENRAESEWIAYMKEIHIPQILKSDLVTSYHFTKVLSDETTDRAYNLQLHYPTRSHLEQYIAELDQEIQSRLQQQFNGKLGSFCTFLEQV